MTKKEAIYVLETIRAIYPKYEISKKKAQILTPQLQPMDHKLVMEKLSAYVGEPPLSTDDCRDRGVSGSTQCEFGQNKKKWRAFLLRLEALSTSK